MSNNYKISYGWDRNTREYTGTERADESPLEPGVFCLPANSTFDEPDLSALGENETYIRNDADTAWEIVKDYRGAVLVKKDKSEIIRIEELGKTPADYPDYTDIVLPDDKQYYYDFDIESESWIFNMVKYKKDACTRVTSICTSANYEIFPQYKRDNVYSGSPASDSYPAYLQGDAGKVSIAKLNTIYQAIATTAQAAIKADAVTTVAAVDKIISGIVLPTEAEIIAEIQGA